MNALFIYTNINGYHTGTYAFGLASIVSVTRASGHNTKVIMVKDREYLPKILEQVADFKPRVIGFTSVSSQFNFVKEISSLIKENFPDIITVCGGVHQTIYPNCILEAKCLDAIFVGESENSFIEFLQKVEKNESYKLIDNLAYAQNGTVKINKLKPLISNLDSLPYPDKEVYPYEDTLKKTGHAPFFFSRGCPYVCSYCSNSMIANRYGMQHNIPRYRSVKSSISEIEQTIERFDIKSIWIQDDIFGLDKKWRFEFCMEYKKRIKIKFLCLLRINLIDEEFIRLLKDAGCFRILIGVESGNDFIRREVLNRYMTNDQIIKAFDIVHKHGIENIAINMIGLPGETEEMLWDTIKLNRRINPTKSAADIFYPYKGTKLGDSCFEKGLVNESIYYGLSNERRETVLNFPEDYKKRIVYYNENWELLVCHPYNYGKRLLQFLRKTAIGGYLRKLKKFIFTLKSKEHDENKITA